jgi:L-seryl-tRNA(Ser) seleniumtransferase
VINATGVVLHTNLGRAPLGESILADVVKASMGYATLEYDLETGKRGHRDRVISQPLAALVGAEDAVVVNNCAAAVLLTATALASGREVLVSRGELVEIGGGFRVPEIIAACGAKLVEVGTTNRTRVADYERAISASTGMVLKVHRSNFALVGFTTEASMPELAALCANRGVPLVHDIGSGAMVDTASLSLSHEPTALESLREGADLVMASGDKLLGGPQAGLIAGRRSLVDQLRKHPLARAMRPGRLVMAALEATLRAYSEGRATERIPVLEMLAVDAATLQRRAQRLFEAIDSADPSGALHVSIQPSEGRVGGGSMPTEHLQSWSVRVRLESEAALTSLERALRIAIEPPIIARIEDGHLVLDVRTVSDAEVPLLATGLAHARATIQKVELSDGAIGGGNEAADDDEAP